MIQRASRQPNVYDALKCVALLAMTIDHIGFFLIAEQDTLRIIGRIAAPLFLLLVGYNGSFRFRRALLMAALLVSVADGMLAGLWWPQNILWTILLTRVVLQYAVPRFKVHELAAAAIALIPVTMPFLDFGSFGLLFALVGYQLRQGRTRLTALLLCVAIALFFGWCYAIILPTLDGVWHGVLAALLIGMGVVIWRADYLAPVRWWPRATQYFAASALYYYVGHKVVLELMAHGLDGLTHVVAG